MTAPNRPYTVVAVVTQEEKRKILQEIARLNETVPVGDKRWTVSTFIRDRVGLPRSKSSGEQS